MNLPEVSEGFQKVVDYQTGEDLSDTEFGDPHLYDKEILDEMGRRVKAIRTTTRQYGSVVTYDVEKGIFERRGDAIDPKQFEGISPEDEMFKDQDKVYWWAHKTAEHTFGTASFAIGGISGTVLWTENSPLIPAQVVRPLVKAPVYFGIDGVILDEELSRHFSPEGRRLIIAGSAVASHPYYREHPEEQAAIYAYALIGNQLTDGDLRVDESIPGRVVARPIKGNKFRDTTEAACPLIYEGIAALGVAGSTTYWPFSYAESFLYPMLDPNRRTLAMLTEYEIISEKGKNAKRKWNNWLRDYVKTQYEYLHGEEFPNLTKDKILRVLAKDFRNGVLLRSSHKVINFGHAGSLGTLGSRAVLLGHAVDPNLIDWKGNLEKEFAKMAPYRRLCVAAVTTDESRKFIRLGTNGMGMIV